MKTKPTLDMADVRKVMNAAIAEAEKNQWVVTLSVVDDGGHPFMTVRMDGAVPMGPYMAEGKARTAAMGRRESSLYEKMINEGRTAYLSAPLNAMLEGGVPILADGQVIGAVGVSGAKPNQDVQIAKAGIAALGLA